MQKRLSFVLAALVVTACEPPPGGTVTVATARINGIPVEFSTATAQLWSDYPDDALGDPFYDQTMDIGECVPMGTHFKDPVAGTVYLDVGPTVRVEGPDTGVDLPQLVDGEIIYYQSSAAVPSFTSGGIYDVVFSGDAGVPAQTWAGVAEVPPFVAYTSPAGAADGALEIPAGQPLTIEWEPGGGDWIEFYLYGDQAQGLACRFADTGAFTLSAEQVATLPASGTFDTGRHLVSSYELLEEREVQVSGVTIDANGTFTVVDPAPL